MLSQYERKELKRFVAHMEDLVWRTASVVWVAAHSTFSVRYCDPKSSGIQSILWDTSPCGNYSFKWRIYVLFWHGWPFRHPFLVTLFCIRDNSPPLPLTTQAGHDCIAQHLVSKMGWHLNTVHLTLQLVPLVIGAGKLLSGSVNPVYNMKLVFQCKESSVT